MKKILLTTVWLIVILISTQAQTWQVHQQRPDLEFSDIKFLNANEGYVFGDSSVNGVFIAGTILKTTDGGQIWTTYTLGNANYKIKKSFFLNVS